MADGLESIIVSYQLDMADAKQQLQDFNAALGGTAQNAVKSMEAVNDSAADVRDSIKNIGVEAQQAFSNSAMNSAIKGMEDYAKATQGAGEQMSNVADSLVALQASGDALKSVSSGMKAAMNAGKDFKAQNDAVLNSLKKIKDAIAPVMSEIQTQSKKMISTLAGLADDVFARSIQNLQKEFQYAETELNKWHLRAEEMAEGSAQKQAAVARVYAAQQLQMQQQQATKEAEIKRQEAEFNKAEKMTEAIINTAVAVTKNLGNPVLTGLAIAEGAAEVAVIAAQPLPPIPKFAEGVIAYRGIGTATSDSNIVAISTGESIIKANATKRYEAELDAIQNLQFESLVFDKYIMPFLQAGAKTPAQQHDYDDWLLRKDVREGNRAIKKSAEFIVKGVSEAVKGGGYFNSRYRA